MSTLLGEPPLKEGESYDDLLRDGSPFEDFDASAYVNGKGLRLHAPPAGGHRPLARRPLTRLLTFPFVSIPSQKANR